MRTLIFMPNHNGMGHITRAIALAQVLTQRGWRCVFDVSGPNAWLVKDSGFLIHPSVTQSMRDMRPRFQQGLPPFVLCQRPEIMGTIVTNRLIKEVQFTMRTINQIRPAAIIGDMEPRARLAGLATGTPLVSIVQQQWYPGHRERWRIWWYKVPPPFDEQEEEVAAYNAAASELGVPGIEYFSQQWEGDLLLCPSIPSIDRLELDARYPVEYVGALLHEEHKTPDPEVEAWLDKITRPIVYMTTGGTYHDTRVIALALSTVKKQGFAVLLATGRQAGNFPRSMETLITVDYLNWRFARRCSIAFHHGGHSSTIAALYSGQPSVIVPYQYEQEGQARRLEATRTGVLVPLNPGQYKAFSFTVGSTPFFGLGHDAVRLAPETIESAFCRAKSCEYMNEASRLSNELRKAGGAQRGADFIEQLVGGPRWC